MATLKSVPTLSWDDEPMDYCQALAVVLVLLRRQEKLDLAQVARRTEFNYHTLFSYELGKRKPPLAALKALSQLYGVDFWEMLLYVATLTTPPDLSPKDERERLCWAVLCYERAIALRRTRAKVVRPAQAARI
jgi:transcriptional regulator with XRE-family HTH domain